MRAVTAPAPPATRHLLLTADAVGGVWTHALDLAAGLAALGTRTTLAVLGPAPDAAQQAAARLIPGLALRVTGLPLDWLADAPRAVTAAGRTLAELAAGADLVQLHAPALAAEAAFPVPVLGACHSCLATWWQAVRGDAPMPTDFAWRSALLARGYAACDALVAPSAAFAEATRRAYRLPAAPHVVPNGRTPAAPARAMGGFAFTAGRLWDEGKGLAVLDRAAARMPLPLLAAGPTRGPNGTAITLRHARALGPIRAESVRRWLARGPVFLSAARYEPFGLSVLEAAQAGCALVLADIPTFRELWDGAARFVAPGDEAGWTQAVAELSRDREQRSSLRVAAQERARGFSVQAMAAGMAALHARLLGAGDGSGARGTGSAAA